MINEQYIEETKTLKAEIGRAHLTAEFDARARRGFRHASAFLDCVKVLSWRGYSLAEISEDQRALRAQNLLELWKQNNLEKIRREMSASVSP